MTDARRFLVNTDYPFDKVVYQQKVYFTIAAFDFTDVDITHNLGFMPLVNAQWSLNANFVPSYNISGGPFTGGSRSYNTSVEADTNHVYLRTTNNTASPVTMYVDLYGLMPSDVNVEPPWDSAFAGDNFVVNTDYNYGKLLSQGIVAGILTPASTSVATSVSHDLGYYPQVACWREDVATGRTGPVVVNQATGPGVPILFDTVSISVTTTEVIFTYYDTISVRDVHYRIYADEQTS